MSLSKKISLALGTAAVAGAILFGFKTSSSPNVPASSTSSVLDTMRKRVKVIEAKRVDLSLPTLFYFGQTHAGRKGYTKEGAESQVQIYELLLEAKKAHQLGAVYVESLVDKVPKPVLQEESLVNLKKKDRRGLENLLMVNPMWASHNFLLSIDNFTEVYGALSPEGRTQVLEMDKSPLCGKFNLAPEQVVGRIDAFLEKYKDKKVRLKKEQAREYYCAYNSFLEVLDKYTLDSIAVPTKHGASHFPGQNIAVIIGTSHLDDLVELSPEYVRNAPYNIVYIPTSVYSDETMQKNLRKKVGFLKSCNDFFEKNEAVDAEFTVGF